MNTIAWDPVYFKGQRSNLFDGTIRSGAKEIVVQTLARQLEEYLEGLKERADPADIAIWSDFARQLVASRSADAAPQVGAVAPDFTLRGPDGKAVSLSEQLAHGPVVLYFVRGGWCPFCTLTLRALARAWPAIRRRGASLLAISPQTARKCLNTIDVSALPFPVLSDNDNAVARRYGLAVALPPAMQQVYRRFGNDIPAINGVASWELPIPAGFVIGPDGHVLLAHIDPHVERRLEPTEALAALDSLAMAG